MCRPLNVKLIHAWPWVCIFESGPGYFGLLPTIRGRLSTASSFFGLTVFEGGAFGPEFEFELEPALTFALEFAATFAFDLLASVLGET